MRIHYCNIRGEEIFLDEVKHIQNLDNERFEITFNNEKTFTIRVEGIEGIFSEKDVV